MWKILFIIFAAIIYFWQSSDPVKIDSHVTDVFPIEYAPSLSINKSPVQNNINTSKKYFQFDEYKITPLADFQLIAKVLAAKHYRNDREADLSPVDLALGWGPMSKQKNLDKLSISQSNRWYHWRTDECYDNAACESFFHTLKVELVYQRRYETREQATRSIFWYIEAYYNRVRRHSSIDYKSPVNFEIQVRKSI